jgi:hypothetical protein
MSQFVETRVGDFLGRSEVTSASRPAPSAPPRTIPRKEEAPKEIPAKLTAEQIFTF